MSKQQDIPNLKVEGIVSKNTCEVVTHYVFIFCVGNKSLKINEKFWKKKSQRNCNQIAQETETEIEICSLNKKNLIFRVKGQNANVIKAKHTIIEIFQIQDTNANSIPNEYRYDIAIKEKCSKFLITLDDRCIGLNTTQDVSCDKTTKLNPNICVTDKVKATIQIPYVICSYLLGPSKKKMNTLMKITGIDVKYVHDIANDVYIVNICGNLNSIQWVTKKFEDDFKSIEKEFIEIFVEMPKQKYKYFIHDIDKFGDDIMEETNVCVVFPEKCSNSETIILRGPYKSMSLGLNGFYAKINSIMYETIECSEFVYKFLMEKGYSHLHKDEQIHFEYIHDMINIEGPVNKIQSITDELKKYINAFVSQNYVVGKKYFMSLISRPQYHIKYIERKCIVIIRADHNKNSFCIHGHESNIKIAIEKLDATIKNIEKILTQEIFILQKPLEKLGHEIISDIEKSFDVLVILSDSPGILSKIRGFQDNANKAYNVLSKLSLMGSFGTFTINTQVQGEHTNSLDAKKYCYSVNNRAEKVYINDLKNDEINVIQALLNALKREDNYNYLRDVEEEHVNTEEVEITEPEVAQALPAALEKTDNNNCEETVKEEENVNIQEEEITEPEVAQALPTALERNNNNNRENNAKEEENVNTNNLEVTEAEVTQALLSVLRKNDNDYESNVEPTEEIDVFYGRCWKCRSYNHKRLDCPAYHRTKLNKPIGLKRDDTNCREPNMD